MRSLGPWSCPILFTLCVMAFVFLQSFLIRHYGMNHDMVADKAGPIKILLWDARLRYESHQKHHKNCRSKCEFIRDRSRLDESEVVIFDGWLLNQEPPKRANDQIWVFFTQEAPTRYVKRPHQFARYDFNLTSTYSVYSDVPIPQRKYYWKTYYDGDLERNQDYTKGKHKMVAWFVSNCKTQSRRVEFVRELSKHIPVDIYGKCGPLDCPRSEEQRCWTMLNTTYKFYLAFENSLCQEYVTEKAWNIYLKNINIVPVVMGGADYSNTLPKNTYINVLDFTGGNSSTVAKLLAGHLKMVAGNKAKYNKYITEKTRYFSKYRLQEYYCNLCNYIANRNRKEHISPQDINQFWMGQEGVDSQCLTATQYLKGDGRQF